MEIVSTRPHCGIIITIGVADLLIIHTMLWSISFLSLRMIQILNRDLCVSIVQSLFLNVQVKANFRDYVKTCDEVIHHLRMTPPWISQLPAGVVYEQILSCLTICLSGFLFVCWQVIDHLQSGIDYFNSRDPGSWNSENLSFCHECEKWQYQLWEERELEDDDLIQTCDGYSMMLHCWDCPSNPIIGVVHLNANE